MGEALREIAQTLIAAVENVMNPAIPHEQRLQAHQVVENFRDNCLHCAEVGVFLATETKLHDFIRHFGLQLIEHCIRYKWNAITKQEKIFIKDNAMKMLASGTGDLVTEHSYIKDGLSKIIVEMIKREWPQQWPSLLAELSEASLLGETQMELVLLIFLRLVEDIVAFQNVPAQRRREIHQALTGSLPETFPFFRETLRKQTNKFKDLKWSTDKQEKMKAMGHCKVAQAALATLAGFVEWISMAQIIADNNTLLELLCCLLREPELQLPAVECLLLIVGRKAEERKPLLVLFSDDAMDMILGAITEAVVKPLEEQQYLFLKRLSQLLAGMGSQIIYLWHGKDEEHQPPNFSKFLSAMLEFTKHPSLVISSYVIQFWNTSFRHEHVSKDSCLLRILPALVETSSKIMFRVGWPSRNDSPSCPYNRIDFDNDEDFCNFFSRHRSEVMDLLRLATIVQPEVTFKFSADWLEVTLRKPIDTGEGADRDIVEIGGVETALCTSFSPSYLEWDALSIFMESVLGKIVPTDMPLTIGTRAIKLLQDILAFNTQDPLILSSALSCISALFPFICLAPEVLPAVLDKIFAAVVFSLSGQTKSTRTKAVRNARRHACSSLVKICRFFPDLLLPSFNQLCNHIHLISTDPEQLSQMEKCTLMEAVILINNQFKNFDKQQKFLGEILGPIQVIWLDASLKEVLWSVEKFMTYIGLDEHPVEPSQDDQPGINRSQIALCINTMLAAVKRSKWPDDLEEAKTGGFLMGESLYGMPMLKNPVANHVLPCLDNLFGVLGTFNKMWLPEFVAHRSPEFARAYDLPEFERSSLLGLTGPPKSWDINSHESLLIKQPLERMQSFLTNVHDCSYHILANAGISLGYDFYAVDGLASKLIETVFSNMDSMADYRLRCIIRIFMKPFVQSCPKEYYSSVLVPVLAVLCPYTYQRLSQKWTVIQQRPEAEEDEGPESQVLEDLITRHLTRDYVDLIVATCQNPNKKGGAEVPTDAMEEDSPMALPHDTNLSELGELVVRTEAICQSIIHLTFLGLSLNDSATCSKCVGICWPLLRQLIYDRHLSEEGAVHLMNSILLGIQQNGQHEGCLSQLLLLGEQAYVSMRPLFPSVAKVMLQIPGVTEASLNNFDEKCCLQTNPVKFLPEKKKKEMFKKLVSQIIGKSVGQLFKREVHFRNLPTMFKKKKPKEDIIATAAYPGICELFHPQS